MKKENVKVLISSNKEAKAVKYLLEQLGENVSHSFYDKALDHKSQSICYFNTTIAEWICDFTIISLKTITIKQLVELLVTGSVDGKATITKTTEQPIIISEDGVPLYEGDKVYSVHISRAGDWQIIELPMKKHNEYVFMQKGREHESKGFSTKEAAEAWIKEQNKPKEIRLHQYSKVPAIVSKERVLFDYSKSNYIEVKGNELKEIYDAWKSLQ